jgi:tRNA dimethylallyltransferase
LESQSTKQLLNQLTKLDPDRAHSVDTANRRRLIRAIEIASAPLKPSDSVDNQVPFQILKIGIIISRRELYQRIDQRIKSRVDRIITETKNLHLQGLSWRRLEAFGLEYRFASRLLRGQLTRSEMVYQLKNSTHDFARRQLTWWRREVDIHWCRNQTAASQKIKTFLKKTGRG